MTSPTAADAAPKSPKSRPIDQPAADALARRLQLQPILSAAALSVPIALLAVMGYQRRWVSDDAFISLRVVRNIVAGHGPVFNIGERVEAHTNALWVGLLAVWGTLGGRLEHGAVWLGLLFAVAGLLLAQLAAIAIARRLERDGPAAGVLIPFGSLVFASIPVVWDFATSGLETGLIFGWLGGSLVLLTRCCLRPRGRLWPGWLGAAALLGLGPLIRPDLAIFSGVFLLALLALRARRAAPARSAGEIAALGLVASATPLAYQIFRMGYYAALTPNTALAKEAGLARWSRGWSYLADFASVYYLWLPLTLLLACWALRLRQAGRLRDWPAAVALAAPVVAAGLYTLYVARVGGDFMHGRFLLPPLLALVAPVGVLRLPRRPTDTPRAVLAGAALVVLLLWAGACALWMRPWYSPYFSPEQIADERAVYVFNAKHPNPVTIDDYAGFILPWVEAGHELRQRAESWPRVYFLYGNDYPLAPDAHPGIALAASGWALGLFSYAAGPHVHVIDHFGLADPLASRVILDAPGRVGHEKNLPDAWGPARFSDPAREGNVPPEVRVAREALACGALPDLLAAVQEPLTLDRFLDNIRRAPEFQRLRFPADPYEARDALCEPRPAAGGGGG